MLKTFRKTFKILVDKKGAGTSDAGNFIVIAIGIAIAVAMIPVIVASVNSVIPNLSGASLILIGLVTLVFVAGILIVIIKKLF